MADRIDAPMQRVQPAVVGPYGDRIERQPARAELVDADDSVLAGCEPRHAHVASGGLIGLRPINPPLDSHGWSFALPGERNNARE